MTTLRTACSNRDNLMDIRVILRRQMTLIEITLLYYATEFRV